MVNFLLGMLFMIYLIVGYTQYPIIVIYYGLSNAGMNDRDKIPNRYLFSLLWPIYTWYLLRLINQGRK